MRQDRNGVRTAQDLERKYNLSDLVGIKKAVEQSAEGINKTNAELENFMKSTLDTIEELENKIDGSITTYYASGVPTLSNYPANEWSASEYSSHVGNMYYDKDTGYSYRFLYDEGEYKWIKISDSEVEEALRIANEAKDTADGKRRVFTVTPFVPYDEGDLWLNNKDLYVCKTPKTSTQTYNSGDWEKATKYTDDSALNTFISGEYANDTSQNSISLFLIEFSSFCTSTSIGDSISSKTLSALARAF
jgi:phage-related protein